MAEIINIAKILKYTYDNGNVVGPEKTASVFNTYAGNFTVAFTKVCSPVDSTQTSAYLNEPILLTYTVTNNTGSQVGLISVEANDPIFTNSYYGEIIAGTETGGTYDETKNTIIFELDNGILNPGESAIFTIQARVTNPTAPLSILNTTATAIIATEDGRTSTLTQICDLQFVHAEVSITKTNAPNSSTAVIPGDVITYTINLINEGNSEAQITVYDFVDAIPKNTTFSQIVSGAPTIIYDAVNDQIKNASIITLGASSSGTNVFEIIFEVIVD